MHRRRTAAVLGVLAVLVVAGCGTARTTGGGDGRATGSAPAPAASAKGPHWVYQDAARDAQGTFVDVTAPAADDMWATASYRPAAANTAGEPHLFHYDGRSWEQRRMPPELDGGVHNTRFAASGPDNVWLFGAGAGGPYNGAAHIARWDGARWHRVPSGPPATLASPLVLGPDDVRVLAADKVWHWDGTRWKTFSLPANASSIDGTSGDDVWAVGYRSSGPGVDGQQYSQPAAMHWDGRSWKLVETPTFRFPDPQPPEASAGLGQVLAMPDGEVLAYGGMSFNHGEVENEPQEESFTLRWDGTRWTDVTDEAPGCELGRGAGPDGHGGLIYLNRWHFRSDGTCRKTTRSELPATGGITRRAQQSLWFERVVPVPGTRKLVGVGHMEVNQSGNPMSKPLIATLEF